MSTLHGAAAEYFYRAIDFGKLWLWILDDFVAHFAGPLIGLCWGCADRSAGGWKRGADVHGRDSVGGSVPPNAQIAGILSTVFAILNGGNAEVESPWRCPSGLAQLLIMFAWNLNIILIHGADKYVEAGDYK